MSDKPLLRTSETGPTLAKGQDKRKIDRTSSAFNVQKEGQNLIPDYSESPSTEPVDDTPPPKKSKPNPFTSWLPTWCPCATFQTL